ncbi:MAG TPA: amidohydrolase family protein [Actinomycetota bacterium]|nr:amidohydrolase family protein [Actinomycetota bacterium]
MRTLYRARRVVPLGAARPGGWVLVDGRHVQRVGSGEPPSADRVVELPGTTILPGFVDTHVHLTSTGLSLANDDVASAGSREALLTIARGRARDGEGVVWLQGFDETTWPDPRLPSIHELDAVTHRPLAIFRADGHVALANHAAIDDAGVAGVRGVELDADGHPTGRLTQHADQALRMWAAQALTRGSIEELQLAAAAVAASRGVTTVHEMSMPHWHGARDLEVLLGHRRLLPLDVTPIVATMDVSLAVSEGFGAVGGDLPVDGSIGARTAALSDPYADGTGTGTAYFDDDELVAFFHDGHTAGLQVGIHAIGDRAIDQVLTAWERVYHALDSRERRHFRARRHRIEHFELATVAHVERAAVLGLAVSIQPAFDRRWGFPGGLYDAALGWHRASAMNPFRTMVERGVELGVGSDSPVTPLDPWLAIAALEEHHDPRQRLSRADAIALHTTGGARLARHEDKKGALAPGMHADLAAYEVDPFDVPSVEGLRPVLTVSLGREVSAV